MQNEERLKLDALFDKMWKDYVQLNPQAQVILNALRARGEVVVNDHIALRTLNHPRLGIKGLSRTFEGLGYSAKGQYEFKEKKLKALHFEHADLNLPKVFISELELEKLSSHTQSVLLDLVSALTDVMLAREDISVLGRPWDVSYETYNALADESEYAAWFSAFGFRPNHFTVSVNHLKTFKSLAEVNRFIQSLGFVLNSSGGEIKGSPADGLEQSSTMAPAVRVKFMDGEYQVPSCYYEFALRYPDASGKLYQGFVAQSADKIFESTHRSL